jgi:small subunit ribosomal protein S10
VYGKRVAWELRWGEPSRYERNADAPSRGFEPPYREDHAAQQGQDSLGKESPAWSSRVLRKRREGPGCKPREGVTGQRIRIRIDAYEVGIIDRAAMDIVNSARRTGAQVRGPIPVPTKIERITVLRSPHVDKKACEQFEIGSHKRIVDFTEPTSKTIDELRTLNMPAGGDIRVKALFDES